MTSQQLVPQGDEQSKYVTVVGNFDWRAFGSGAASTMGSMAGLGGSLRQTHEAATHQIYRQPLAIAHLSAMRMWRTLHDTTKIAKQITDDDVPRSARLPRAASEGQSFVEPLLRNRSERRRWSALKRPRLDKVAVLNKWQGRVREISEHTFRADLFDLMNSDLTETAEFEWSEISNGDRELVRPGAEFYWYIWCHDHANGDRTHESKIWFRRGGRMTQEEYEESLRRTKDVWESFGWKDSTGQSTGS